MAWDVDVWGETAALIVVLDGDGRVLAANPAALAATGRAEAELVGSDVALVLAAPREAVGLTRAVRLVARTGVPRSHEHDLPASGDDALRRTVSWVTSRLAPDPARLLCVGVDVSAARAAVDDLMARALTDDLTGLPNRTHLTETLGRLAGSGASVLFCDLNGFKTVNDTFGHAAGDAVLVEVARRLKLAVRGEDFVARLGGDEFVIVAPPHPTASPEGLARRVLGAMRQPMILTGGVVAVVGVSVGTACLEPGSDPIAVLGQADARMYSAKSLRTSQAGTVEPRRAP